MEERRDFIVVGSGAAGAQAAQTLLAAGGRVLLLDVGERDDEYRDLIPDKSFADIRREEADQHRYFLGREYEGVPWSDSRVGAQLTPPRKHLLRRVAEWIPTCSDTFFPAESLATGGLTGGWGTGSQVFSDAELTAMGVDPREMEDAYRTVAGRIGISGERDDATDYTSRYLDDVQPAPPIEHNLKGIFDRYRAEKGWFHRSGFRMGRTSLALLTRDKGSRKGSSLHDMDFWSDTGRSAYRAWITVEQLLSDPDFEYRRGHLALSFTESEEGVELHAVRTDTREHVVLSCRKLVLAPGVLGTARIILRSANRPGQRLPLLCNPYAYIPCLQWRMLGQLNDERKISVSQLALFHDPDGENRDVAMAALFSYSSLLLFRLVKESPLNLRDGRAIMHVLQSAFTIAGLHHPDAPSADKHLWMESADTATGDILCAHYTLSPSEQEKVRKREALFHAALRRLGCFPIKSIRTPPGGSIHYAGALPYADEETSFTLARDGRLHGTRAVFVADGSGFRALPAKGITLSLMANAHRTALHASR